MSAVPTTNVTGATRYTPAPTLPWIRYAAAMTVYGILLAVFTIDRVCTKQWRAITIACGGFAIAIALLAIAGLAC